MGGKLSCVVVGGGLGGLSAALALAQAGHTVTLLEQAARIEPIGYGIQLGPNVMPFFAGLGVLEPILARAHLPSAVQMVDARSGRMIVPIPLGAAFRARFNHPYICIHRGDLHAILVAACEAEPGIRLRKGVTVTGYAQRGARAVALSEAHGEIEGDVVIGADGINSRLRAQMHPASEAQPIGYVAHRTIVPFDEAPDILRRDPVVMWAGEGFHVIYYPLPGYGMNLVGVFSVPEGEPVEKGAARRDQLLARCADGHPELRAALGAMDFQSRWALADRKPLRGWSEGHTVLVGDAVHATFQSLAQGACMAIEDGVILADCLDEAGTISDALRAYEARRLVRTARVQLESRALWSTYHLGGIAAEVRDAQFAERNRDDVYDCLAWVWTAPERGPAQSRASAA